MQCDFPGVWVTWFVMFSYTGHLIGLAHGPLPLQIESLVKETPAVCIDPSGDSEGGGEMQGHLWSGHTLQSGFIYCGQQTTFGWRQLDPLLTRLPDIYCRTTGSEAVFICVFGYKERRWMETKTRTKHYPFASGSVLVKVRNIICPVNF